MFNYNPDKVKEIERTRTLERNNQFIMQNLPNNQNKAKNVQVNVDLPIKGQIFIYTK